MATLRAVGFGKKLGFLWPRSGVPVIIESNLWSSEEEFYQGRGVSHRGRPPTLVDVDPTFLLWQDYAIYDVDYPVVSLDVHLYHVSIIDFHTFARCVDIDTLALNRLG